MILVRTFTHKTLLPYLSNLTFKRYQCCEAVHEDKCRSHHVITRTDDSSGNKSPKASTDHVQVATQVASPASHIALRCAPPPAAPEIASRTPLQDKVSRGLCYQIGTLRSLWGTCCSSSLFWKKCNSAVKTWQTIISTVEFITVEGTHSKDAHTQRATVNSCAASWCAAADAANVSTPSFSAQPADLF